jgi:ubiquinone/menaquinone biosynthesis C-methylase UbiE
MWSPFGLLAIWAFHNTLLEYVKHQPAWTSSSSSSSRRIGNTRQLCYSSPLNENQSTQHKSSSLSLVQRRIVPFQGYNKLQETEYKHDTNVDTSTITRNSFPTTRRRIFSSLASVGICTATIVSYCDIVHAISSTEAESSYDRYAPTYDALDGGSLADSLGIERARTKIMSLAQGNVLEIGAGTGVTLEKYKFASSPHAMDGGVTSLTLLDVSEGMMAQARDKLRDIRVPDYVNVHFVKADATKDLIDLYGIEGYFDTVVDTFSLCVMGNDGAKNCLRQMQQVVKKDSGRILLIENARSSNAVLGLYQDWTANAAANMGGKGCISNQNVGDFIRTINALELVEEEEYATGVFRSFVCKRVH